MPNSGLKIYKIGVREKGYLDREVIIEATCLMEAIDCVTKEQISKKSKSWKTRLISERDCYGKILRKGNGKYD